MKPDELDELTNEIECGFRQQNGRADCRYLLGKLVARKDAEIVRLQAKFTGEASQSPLEQIRAKCEQYWNEPCGVGAPELHRILEMIHQWARSAEAEIERLRGESEALADVIESGAKAERQRSRHAD